MSVNRDYIRTAKILKLICWTVAVLVMFVFTITSFIRNDTIKRMNYSYNQLMETFPEFSGVDALVAGAFDSLDKDTLQMEMYQSYFKSMIYSLPIMEGVTEDRIINYHDMLVSNAEDGWNKELSLTLEKAMETIHTSDILYGKEYVFNMQKDFVLNTALSVSEYLLLSICALAVFVFSVVKIICLIIVKILSKIKGKKVKPVIKARKVSSVPIICISIGLLTLLMFIPIFGVVKNVHEREMTNVINIVQDTINNIPAEETNLFDNDKSFNIVKYGDSSWYVKRISYELADYLLYKYKTTGDDSLLTEYCANLNDLDKEFAYTISRYIGESKDNIDSFIPVFDTMENTVATEMLYSTFTTLESSNITNDWYNLETVMPMMIFLYLCAVVFIVSIISSETYKDMAKEIK